MARIGFDPLRVDQAESAEAAEEWVHGALHNDEASARLEIAQDFKAIEGGFPQDGENGEFEGPFAELDLPLLGAFGDGRQGLLHGKILCSAWYSVKYFLDRLMRRGGRLPEKGDETTVGRWMAQAFEEEF
jgi:hypothetical protein